MDKHLFISYAHIDNKPFAAGQEGWVSRLHVTLDAMLSMRLGYKAEIWRDAKLDGDDVFGDEIAARFRSAAVLLSVISPRYIKSDWCKKELNGFCAAAAEEPAGLVVGNKSRAFKIVKLPVESEDDLPPVMKKMLGYAFFTMDESETPIELDPAYGPELAQKYNRKVAVLAADIAQMVSRLMTDTPDAEPGLSVYLAECAFDRRDDREELAAELKMRGYKVLPEHQLPVAEDEYAAEVSRLLRGSSLAIHLIGKSYGAVPDGPGEQSAVMIQNALAAEQSRTAGLARIIWVPEGTKSDHPLQRVFLADLAGKPGPQLGADLITSGIESLKEAVRGALTKLEAPKAPKKDDADADAPKLVYIICDERDREATMPLRKFFREKGLTSRIPLFTGDAAEVRQENQKALAECQAVVVFYGAGDEAWKRTVDNEMRKIRGYRPGKPLPPVFSYIAGPETADKRELIELEADLINALSGFDGAALNPLLDKLR